MKSLPSRHWPMPLWWVSDSDRRVVQDAGVQAVYIVGHSISSTPTPSPHHERAGFLFVGSVHGSDNPNADSIREFCSAQWAKIHRETGAVFTIAGYGTELLGDEIIDPTVQILGAQSDLRPLYNCGGSSWCQLDTLRACRLKHMRRPDMVCQWSCLR